MNIKNLAYAAACWLLVGICAIQAQTTQQKKWVVGDKILDMTTNPPTVTKSFATPSIYPGNAATDRFGNILFYIRDAIIYNMYHEAVGQLPPQTTNTNKVNTEVSIVPFINDPLSSCYQRYYVFYGKFYPDLNNYYRVDLCMKIVSVSLSQRGVVTVTDYNNANGTPQILATATTTSRFVYPSLGGPYERYFEPSCGLAVGKIKYNSTTGLPFRNLFFVAGNSVQRIDIGRYSPMGYGLSSATTVANKSQLPNFDFGTWEADLSHDGSMLVWASKEELYLTNGIERHHAFLIGLNASGGYNGFNRRVDLPAKVGGDDNVVGVEFTADNSRIFIANAEKVYVHDVGNNTTTTVVTSFYAAFSQVELGEDGGMYIANYDTVLYRFSTTAPYPYTTMKGLVHTEFPLYHRGVFSPRPAVRCFPDQIDGENIADLPAFDYSLYQDPIDPITKLPTTLTISGGVNRLNSAYFGGKGTIRLEKGLNITGPGTVVIIDTMDIMFGENAQISLGQGVTLRVNKSIFRGPGNGCNGAMWMGITAQPNTDINNPTKIFFNDSTLSLYYGYSSTISDAIIGLSMLGKGCELNLIGVAFQGNHINVSLQDEVNVPTFWLNSFTNSIPLANQNYGSNIGYSDGLNRTLISVYAKNMAFKIGRGYTFGGFVGYQLENYAGRIDSNVFFYVNSSSISLLNVTDKNKQVLITNGNIQFCKTGITANKFAGKLEINSCNFSQMSGFGIDVFNSKGIKLYVGKYADSLAAHNYNDTNLFTSGGGQAAINLNDNATEVNSNPTQIHLAHNYITAPVNGINNKYGIVITESTGGTRKYGNLQVYENNIENYNTGMLLNNVVGANKPEPKESQQAIYNVCNVYDNKIYFDASNPNNSGLQLWGATGSNVLTNIVAGNNVLASFKNNAMSTKLSPNVLIWNNSLSSGLPFRAEGNMVNASYYCNNLIGLYSGMYLHNHKLRPMTDTHGDAGLEARHNNYGVFKHVSRYSDILLSGVGNPYNSWIFQYGNVPSVKTATLAGISVLTAGYGPNTCSNIPGIGTDQPGGNDFTADTTSELWQFHSLYYNQQQYLSGNVAEGVSDANIINLLDAENLFAQGNYTEGLRAINSINVPNGSVIWADYKQLYQIWGNYKLTHDTTVRGMDSATADLIMTIAIKNPVDVSPAALSARAIMWHERQTEFFDSYSMPDVLAGYITTDCNGGIVEGLTVYLQRDDLQEMPYTATTNNEGVFEFSQEVIDMLDANRQFRFKSTMNDGIEGMTIYSEWGYPDNLFAHLTAMGCLSAMGKKGNDTKPVQGKQGFKINDVANQNMPEIRIFPNPSNGLINITGISQATPVVITDILGKVVLRTTAMPNETINLTGLKAGIYFLTLDHEVHKISIR